MNSNKIGLNTIYQTPFDINLLMYIYEMIYTKEQLEKLRTSFLIEKPLSALVENTLKA
jgi:hypothetical protein